MNKIIFALMTLLPTLAFAHDDHGASMLEGLWHVFASPEHIWPLTAGVVLVVVLWVRSRS